MCHHPAVLLSCSAAHSRLPVAYTDWKWAEKTVVELGCGSSALPACAAAIQKPRAVICTDGNADVLPMTSANVERWLREHPGSTRPMVRQLRWGEGSEADVVVQGSGLAGPADVDVVLAADCVYVLENPNGWGKLLKTILALSGPATLVFVTYTDRGHGKLWARFVAERVERHFRVIEVPTHLLHPFARPGTKGRLEQITPCVQVFCWSRRTAVALMPSSPPATH
jgi:hypothetical protein